MSMFKECVLKDLSNVTYNLCDELRKVADQNRKVSSLAKLHLIVRAWYPEQSSNSYQLEICLNTFGPQPETLYRVTGFTAWSADDAFKREIGM